jgi:hypothetical protein
MSWKVKNIYILSHGLEFFLYTQYTFNEHLKTVLIYNSAVFSLIHIGIKLQQIYNRATFVAFSQQGKRTFPVAINK